MSDTDQPQKPEILVDDDWKSQAQAEKEKLAQADAEAAQKAAERGGAGVEGAGVGELPPSDFQALLGVMVSMALPYLGGMEDKKTGGVVFDPDISRFYIDLLGVLEEKTKGNLTEEEATELSAALNGMRMQYVELSKLLAQQVVSGGSPSVAGGPGASPLEA